MSPIATGLWGALILGLAGSLHCAGMCGPLIMALPPGNSRSLYRFWMMRLSYHTGRAATYALFGWIAGMFGYNLKLAGLQQSISVLGGILLLLIALWPALQRRLPSLNFVWLALRPIQNRFFRQAGLQQQFFAGAFNALLPCGLLYTALAAAVVMSHPLYSALFMGIFGLATMPGLLLVSILKRSLHFKALPGSARYGMALTLLLGIWMLIRGLGLGIPLLSPAIQNVSEHTVKTESAQPKVHSCH